MGGFGAATAAMVWMWATTLPAAADATTGEGIAAAIEGFEPCWSPPAGSLHGLVVALAPLNAGPDGPPGTADDLALMTAAHLFHLLRAASGDAVLLRRDDLPFGDDASVRAAGMVQACKVAGAHLLLTIGKGEAETAAGATDRPTARIARRIADCGAGVLQARAGREDPPEVVVTLPADGGRPEGSGAGRRHQRCAEAVCRGLLEIAAEDPASLQRLRRQSPPTASAPSDRFDHDYDRKVRLEIARIARQLRPEGDLPPDEAAWFLAALAAMLNRLNTSLVYELQVEIAGGTVMISGCTTAEPMLATAALALEAVGLEPAASGMRLLPDRARLSGRIFGVCQVTTAMTFAEPSPLAGPQTQLMWGEPVFLLDARDGWLRLLSADGYAAWAPQEAIERIDEAAFDARLSAPWGVVTEDLEVAGQRLRRGTRLAVMSRAAGTVTTLSPAGESLRVPASAVRFERGTDEGPARAATALDMLHVPYVFGAQSPIGLDCSGLVANVWLRHGVHLPRDAAQQALGGRLVATSWHRGALQAGDRLYFINAAGKVFHTGIALSASHFVHASPPAVKINSLMPGDRLYAEEWDRTFFIARRP